MMAEFQAAIRGLEEKLEASRMENDLLQQRLAEIVNERSGNCPAPPLKFANPSEKIATSTKNFANPSENLAKPSETDDFYLSSDGGGQTSDTSDFY